jgi:hypothetical protein
LGDSGKTLEIRDQRPEVGGQMTPVKFAALVFFEECNGQAEGRGRIKNEGWGIMD